MDGTLSIAARCLTACAIRSTVGDRAGTCAKGGRSMTRHRILVLAALALVLAHRAAAQDAQVMHWWTSGGESKAVAVFAKEYEKRGGKWIDGASVGPQAEHAAVLNAIC